MPPGAGDGSRFDTGSQDVMTADRWIKPETEVKENDFAGLMDMVTNACKGIFTRHRHYGDPPFLYGDLHGGPGILRYPDGHCGDGSPLIAIRTLERSGMPYQTVHFERDPQTAGRLEQAIAPYIHSGHSTVINGPFESGMSAWLAANGRQEYRYGLVYSDPIGDPLPVAALNQIAHYLPRVDLLAYVIANDQYKRANGGGARRGRIADDIAAVRKKHVLIRKESDAHQFTFVLWTDLPGGYKAWKAHGFYPLESEAGQAVLDRINYTKAELVAQFNAPLWEDGDDALSAAPA